MEQEEDFISKWDELFKDNSYAKINEPYHDGFHEVSDLLLNYRILEKYPFHIQFNNFCDDTQKRCFALRISPTCYDYFPDEIKEQRSIISTLLTTSYSAHFPDYNLKGYFHKLSYENQSNRGYINLALLYHPYTYCLLSENLREDPKIIKKLMMGLLNSKTSTSKVIEILESIPLNLLKNYLREKYQCSIFSEIVFEENEFENLDFWNNIKKHLHKDSELNSLYHHNDKITDYYEQIKYHKKCIKETYIHLNYNNLQNLRGKNTTHKTTKI